MTRIFLLLVFCIATCVPAVATDVIGLSLPLDGRLSPVSKRIEFGARLAVKHLRSSGRDIRLSAVNDQCDDTKIERSAGRLERAGVDIVIGSVCFKVAAGLAKALNSQQGSATGVPVIAIGTRNRQLGRLRDIDELPLFSLSQDPAAEARAVVEKILPRFGDRPFAVLDDGSVYGRSLSDDLRLLGEQSGQQAIQFSNFRPLQTNQIALLRRLQKSGVEALFIAAAADDVVTIANDLKNLSYDWMIATGERGALLPYVASIDSDLSGVVMVREDDLANSSNRQIIGKPGDFELDNNLLIGYALVQIASQATKQDVGDLAGKSFNTIIGKLTFGSDGRATPGAYSVLEWQDGILEPVRTD